MLVLEAPKQLALAMLADLRIILLYRTLFPNLLYLRAQQPRELPLVIVKTIELLLDLQPQASRGSGLQLPHLHAALDNLHLHSAKLSVFQLLATVLSLAFLQLLD